MTEKQKRLSYTNEFKIMVAAKAKEVGNREAGRMFEVDEKCIRAWRAKYDYICQMDKWKRKNRQGTPWWLSLEENLCRWICAQRQLGIHVSMPMIRKKAADTAKEMDIDNFKGGVNWCYRFMKRRRISLPSEAASEVRGISVNSWLRGTVPSLDLPGTFDPDVLYSGGFQSENPIITDDSRTDPMDVIKTELLDEDSSFLPMQNRQQELNRTGCEVEVKCEVFEEEEQEETEGEEILPNIRKNTVRGHQRKSDALNSLVPVCHTPIKSFGSVESQMQPRTNNIASSILFQENCRLKECVLAGKIDLTKFPFGWAPLLLPYKLRVLRIKEDVVLICVEVSPNGEFSVKVLNTELPKSHPIYVKVLNYCSVNDLNDLAELLDRIDEWIVCLGINEKQFVDFYHRNGQIENCRFVAQLSSLYSTKCEIMLPGERKTSVCEKCKMLCRTLTSVIRSSIIC